VPILAGGDRGDHRRLEVARLAEIGTRALDIYIRFFGECLITARQWLG